MAITNKDVDKLKEVFETKEEAFQRHNEIMTTLDKLMKEKETAGQERILALSKDREQDRRLSGLENRMNNVEVKVGA